MSDRDPGDEHVTCYKVGDRVRILHVDGMSVPQIVGTVREITENRSYLVVEVDGAHWYCIATLQHWLVTTHEVEHV